MCDRNVFLLTKRTLSNGRSQATNTWGPLVSVITPFYYMTLYYVSAVIFFIIDCGITIFLRATCVFEVRPSSSYPRLPSAKCCFFRGLRCSASPWRKTAYSPTQSTSWFDAPGTEALALWSRNRPRTTSDSETDLTVLGFGREKPKQMKQSQNRNSLRFGRPRGKNRTKTSLTISSCWPCSTPWWQVTYLSSSSSSSTKLRRSNSPPILLPGSQIASSLTASRILLYWRSSANDGTSKPSSLRIASSFSISDLQWATVYTHRNTMHEH